MILVFSAALSPLAARSAGDSDEITTIQRMHRVVTATLAYVADNDRSLPLSMSFSTQLNSWRTDSFTAVPAGWTHSGGREVPPRSIEEASVYLNAIQGYGADYQVFGAAGVPLSDVGFRPTRPQPVTYRTGFSYNGQLHGWPLDSVVSPTQLTMYMQAYRQNLNGATYPFVVLCCSNLGPSCRFNPTGYPQPGQTSCRGDTGYGYMWWQFMHTPNFTAWVYKRRIVIATVDGSARSIEYEAPTWPQYAHNVNESPWSTFAPAMGDVPQGSPGWMTDCVEPGGHKSGGVYYAGYFRPDNEFNYTIDQCDFGGG